MKKFGFTLAEVLIAVAILGVVTAVTLPIIHKLIPDKEKGMVLQAYKTITEINSNILNDPGLYMLNTRIEGTNTDCTAIMACTSKPVDGEHETGYSGADKYPHLLSDNLTLSRSYNKSQSAYDFATVDGLNWTIYANNTDSNNPDYLVILDTGNPARENCVYNKNTCKNPRNFQLRINANGEVTYADNLTRVYLENTDSLTDRNADLAKAATY